MSYIQLPYGYVRNNKQIQFNLPNNYEESFYFKKALYLTNKNPAVENNLTNSIKNRDDLKRWLLATSDYGREIQDNLNAVVGYNEKFNNSIVKHALDLKDETIFRNPNPINVTFYMKKFDQVNPVIGKLAAQVKASKLTKQEINQKLLDNFEADTIQARLDELKYGSPDDGDDDDDNKNGPRGTPGGTPLDDVDELQKRLDRLHGNDVSPHNTPEQKAKIIQRKNSEKFINQQLRQREKELSNLPKGNVGKKRSSIRSSLKFRLPETPSATPFDDNWDDVADKWIKNTSVSGPPEPPLFNYEHDFPPLSRSVQKAHLSPITPKTSLPIPPSNTPRETSFLTPEESVSPLRNKLSSIALLPSRPNKNNFS